jgi:uncharacterized membrane protein
MLIAAVWSLGLLFIYMLLHRGKGLEKLPLHRAGVIIFLLALGVRLVPNLLVPAGGNYDMQSYQIVGDLVRQSEDVYRATAGENRYPYLPLLLYWLGISQATSEVTQLPFAPVVRLLPILADASIAWLIFFYLKRNQSMQDGVKAGMLYAVNPVSIFVSAYHGQFDAVAMFFLVSAGILLVTRPHLASYLLGAGILVKSWPVLAFPAFIMQLSGWRKKILFTVGMMAIPLAGVLIYSAFFEANPTEVFQRALGYNRGMGVWGITYLLRVILVEGLHLEQLYQVFLQVSPFVTLLFLGVVWWLKARHESVFESTLTIFIAFFFITHAFAIQYLLWLVPLGLLTRSYRWTNRYILAAFSYMLLVYFTLILQMRIDRILSWPAADLWIIIPASLSVWLICAAWLVDRWRSTTQLSANH